MSTRKTPELVERVRNLLQTGMPLKEIAAELGISIPTIYAWTGPGKRYAVVGDRREEIVERIKELLPTHTYDEIAAELGISKRQVTQLLPGGFTGAYGSARERNTRSEAGTIHVRGYIDFWKPQKATRKIIEDVQEVLTEYAEHLPLTIRQIFYRLVGKHGYPKTEDFYIALIRHLANARRARRIDFDAIRDDGIMEESPYCFSGVGQFYRHLRSLANDYRLDLMDNQDTLVVVWCEAKGMLPQLARVADPYCITCLSKGGFDSVTAKKALADRIAESGKDAAIILHLGDYDPSGESMFDVLSEDVTAFLEEDAPDISVDFRRVTLTAEQVKEYGLPTAPAKESDKRSKNWVGETCQLEALPPDIIAQLLRAAIVAVIDLKQMDRDRETEEQERAEIVRKLERLE